MNPEIGSDPFLRPQVGHLSAARQAAAAGPPVRQSAALPGPDALGPKTQVAAPDAAARIFHQRSDEVGGYVGEAGPHEATGDFTFEDLIDLVNPLQHIPGVASLYREITGDQISPPAEVLGGLLYGGPVGFVSAMANTLVREASGRDIGQNVISAVFGDGAEGNSVAAAPSESNAAPPAATLANEQAKSHPAIESAPLPSAPPSAIPGGPPTASLTGDAALKALAADLGLGGSLSQPKSAPARAGDESPAAASEAQPRVPTMALRDRDWRARGPETRPRNTALTAPGRLASAVPAYQPDLQALDRGGLVPGLPAARTPQPLDTLARSAGPYPSAVDPHLLANSQQDEAFAGRMLEALEKYESMKQQGQP